ncbi:hypothetical protein SFRURICE_005144 [Spodoptera frugiperda]|nr:hypothetical protein SFRURICE_005144 [Spodoptera frugiperda]
MLRSFIPEGVGRGAHYGMWCAHCQILGTFPDSVLPLRNFRKIENSPAILHPTRESNPKPLSRHSHLQPLGQRGIRLPTMYRSDPKALGWGRQDRSHSGQPLPDQPTCKPPYIFEQTSRSREMRKKFQTIKCFRCVDEKMEILRHNNMECTVSAVGKLQTGCCIEARARTERQRQVGWADSWPGSCTAHASSDTCARACVGDNSGTMMSTRDTLGRAGLQYFGVFIVVHFVDPGLQELQWYGRFFDLKNGLTRSSQVWRGCARGVEGVADANAAGCARVGSSDRRERTFTHLL